jgi:hypothetical protein
MVNITNCYNKCCRKYKSEIEQTRAQPWIRCLGGVNTPCRPVTSAVRWDQVPRRSKHPLLTGHIRREVGSGTQEE